MKNLLRKLKDLNPKVEFIMETHNKVFLRIFRCFLHALVVTRTHRRVLLTSSLPLQSPVHSYLFLIQAFLVASARLVVRKIYYVSSDIDRFVTLYGFIFTTLNESWIWCPWLGLNLVTTFISFTNYATWNSCWNGCVCLGLEMNFSFLAYNLLC